MPEKENVSYTSVLELPFREPDAVFSYGSDPLQRAELWRRPDIYGHGDAPVLAFIHGGCWLNAYDIAHTRALTSMLANAGYAVWSLEYRRTGDEGGGWPGTFEDILAGLNALQELAPEGLDLSRVAVAGHSAGGHLALLAATSDQLELEPKVTIGLAPIVDLVQYGAGDNSCQQATPQFMGGSSEEIPQVYDLASVDPYALDEKQVVALVGDLDSIVPLAQSEALPQRVINGAGHFDFVHTGTPAFRALLKELAKHL